MSKDALVTVVIPVYNSENYIKDCLHATTNQTYSNLNIIIVDDGSSDATLSICNEFAKKDNRIKIISSCNNGVSAARNQGIKNACGKYIVFFDADDYPNTDLIERYMKAHEEWSSHEVSIIMCGMYYDSPSYRYSDNGEHILVPSTVYLEGENYLLDRRHAATFAWLKIFNFVTNKLYDLDILKQYEILFDEKVHIGEDLKFNIDYLNMVPGQIGMVNSPLYHYVKRSSNSLSFTYHEDDISDTKTIYNQFLNWEGEQPGVTSDDILVVESIFLTDWTSRLSTMHDHFKKIGKLRLVKKELNDEIGSSEFQDMLRRVYDSGKISTVRYLALKTGKFNFFFYLRGIYQALKRLA